MTPTYCIYDAAVQYIRYSSSGLCYFIMYNQVTTVARCIDSSILCLIQIVYDRLIN